MRREWKPGAVALIEAGCHANRKVAIRTGVPSHMGWAYSDTHDGKSTQTWTPDTHGTVSVVRPLVVIDPEDPESVNRLADAICRTEFVANAADDDLADALREFADPTPPRPEEPTGLGAVVEDTEGQQWLRHHGAIAPWHRADTSPGDKRPWRYYRDIEAVRVLSEGVAE